MEDTATPMALQVVAKLSFRYGQTADEKVDSYVVVRVNAFASKACVGRSFEPISLGTPIKGIVEVTDSDYGSAQLLG